MPQTSTGTAPPPRRRSHPGDRISRRPDDSSSTPPVPTRHRYLDCDVTAGSSSAMACTMRWGCAAGASGSPSRRLSTHTVCRPAASPPAMSLARSSPTIHASCGCRPTAARTWRNTAGSGFADAELTLHHHHVEVGHQADLVDLAALAGRFAVGNQRQRHAAAAQLYQRLQGAGKRLQPVDPLLHHERTCPVGGAVVPPAQLGQGAARDAGARAGLVEAPPVRPLPVLPIPAVGGEQRRARLLPVPAALAGQPRRGLPPGVARGAVGVDHGIVHVEQHGGGQADAGRAMIHRQESTQPARADQRRQRLTSL